MDILYLHRVYRSLHLGYPMFLQILALNIQWDTVAVGPSNPFNLRRSQDTFLE